MKGYLYKIADQGDVNNLATLEVSLLDEIIHRTNTKHFLINKEEIHGNIQQFIAEKKMWFMVGYHNNQAIGFIGVTEANALYTHGKFGIITEFYILEAYRSNGVGKSLLNMVFDLAKKMEWNRLEVTTPPLPEFENSLRFYKENGFTITGGKKLKYDAI